MPSHEFDPRIVGVQDVLAKEKLAWKEILRGEEYDEVAQIDLLKRLNFVTKDRLEEVEQENPSNVRLLQSFLAKQIELTILPPKPSQTSLIQRSKPAEVSIEEKQQRKEDRLRYLQRLMPGLLDQAFSDALEQSIVQRFRDSQKEKQPEAQQPKAALENVFEQYSQSPLYSPDREYRAFTSLLEHCITDQGSNYPKSETFFQYLQSQAGLSQDQFKRVLIRALNNVLINNADQPIGYEQLTKVLNSAGMALSEAFPAMPTAGRERLQAMVGRQFRIAFFTAKYRQAEELALQAERDGILSEDLAKGFLPAPAKLAERVQEVYLDAYRQRLSTKESRAFVIRYGGEAVKQAIEQVEEAIAAAPKEPGLYLIMRERGFLPSTIKQVVDYVSTFPPFSILSTITVARLDRPFEREEYDHFIQQTTASPRTPREAKVFAQKTVMTPEEGEVFIGFETK